MSIGIALFYYIQYELQITTYCVNSCF